MYIARSCTLKSLRRLLGARTLEEVPLIEVPSSEP